MVSGVVKYYLKANPYAYLNYLMDDRHGREIHNGLPLIPGLQSKNNRDSCYIRFENCTSSLVEVLWIDFHGAPVLYKVLSPTESLKVKTYKTHPWVFRDRKTREKFQVNSRDIFLPEDCVIDSVHPIVGEVSPWFVTQVIHYPLYNLKERASLVVQRSLSDPQQAYELDIPDTLKDYVAETKFRH